MTSDLPRYTLRIPQEYLAKIRYIAEENGRSANKEIELMIKQRIKDYENSHGEIDLSEAAK
ncbi:MAG TPA: Arc family DNA-binding protein [Candidatus Limivivens intestinipullorum]|uniref:Arc family DNA-binding protein n=1 Tax=Candidatus Limivivens intestinipullorum TaxID=2840858 RepID=A0A9D1ETY7_9FIRM|nr:Arc family DNA-binding protein [Candidatus Limivivens intestinipullorum]